MSCGCLTCSPYNGIDCAGTYRTIVTDYPSAFSLDLALSQIPGNVYINSAFGLVCTNIFFPCTMDYSTYDGTYVLTKTAETSTQVTYQTGCIHTGKYTTSSPIWEYLISMTLTINKCTGLASDPFVGPAGCVTGAFNSGLTTATVASLVISFGNPACYATRPQSGCENLNPVGITYSYPNVVRLDPSSFTMVRGAQACNFNFPPTLTLSS